MEKVEEKIQTNDKPMSAKCLHKRNEILKAATNLFATTDYHHVLVDYVANRRRRV